MFVCIQKNTGKLVDSASTTTEGTLINNMKQYYTESDLEEKEVTQEEFQAILNAIPKEPQPKTTVEINTERITSMEDAVMFLMDISML